MRRESCSSRRPISRLLRASRLESMPSIEAKVAQFVGLCERLRAENHDLRQQLATAKNDAKRLNERIEGAKLKLESLLARLPD